MSTSSPYYCTSCCSSCLRGDGLPPRSTSSDPAFALKNLLPLGTVSLNVPTTDEQLSCDHIHSEDGWHNFRAEKVLHCLSDPDDIVFCRGLEYLIKERFIIATRCSNIYTQMMDIRIYLIPYDLPHVQGKLRLRKEGVLGPARRYMRTLLPKVSQDVNRWNRLKPVRGDVPITYDTRSLAEIYSDLASPQPVSSDDSANIVSRLLDFGDDLDGLGMRSTLYRYQRRSIAAMIQKELNLQDVPDPLYIPLKTIYGQIFYIQPGTAEVLQDIPMSATCRGGILCEELGTGKTVMMLGLILATRRQLSTPEPSLVDDRPIMTPIAYRSFPSSEFSTARKRACFVNAQQPQVPSLVDLMLHCARSNPFADTPTSHWNQRYIRNTTIEEEITTLPLGEVLRNNVPFYHHYLGEPHNRERVQRNKQSSAPKTMYLTSATLIVVPSNLLSQWDREIQKHCSDQLRVFILRAKTPVPSVQSLATDYDIIIMTYTRFSAESTKHDTGKLHVNLSCKCPPSTYYKVPNCHCQITDVSALLQIRWKRLIIDEGHVSSALSTNLVPFAKMLSVERRWIVTGTPTTNLLGLSLGNKSAVDDLENDAFDTSSSQTPSLSGTAIPVPTPADMDAVQTIPAPATRHRTWTKYDREDLNKLGNMIAHFIAVPQFCADPKLFSTHIVEPLLDPHGPRAGAIQVLNQVMEMVMIRHRIEDVEQEVVLPPLKHEPILLDLDPYVILSFNALQAGIIINAVDSERKDQDYLFHPMNADALQTTVKNMSQLLFWHVDNNFYNAKDLLRSAEKTLSLAKERNMSQQDIVAAEEAFYHLKKAMQDPMWQYIQTHEDVPYRVYNLNEEVYNAWSRIPSQSHGGHDASRLTGLLHADMLVGMDELLTKRPLIHNDELKNFGVLMLQRDKAARHTYEESLKKARRKSKNSNEDSPSSHLVDKFSKKASSMETLGEIQKELNATLALLDVDDEDEVPSKNSLPRKRLSSIAASSQHAKIRIGSSASSKLNYIINEVEKYSKDEKFLIFSESPLTLAHVAEALQLKHIKFLRFTTQVTPQLREQLVLTFETSETYRIFLMELRHGARGLNLVSASRVIFCEPVWQADVESQAIKRAHRIGQVRPITVKTLAIRHTAEENMVARRNSLLENHEKLPKVQEEAGMRHYIANPQFITETPRTTCINEFPLVIIPPGLLGPRPGALTIKIPPLKQSPKRVRVEDPNPSTASTSKEDSEREPPTKKKKEFSVRFAVL